MTLFEFLNAQNGDRLFFYGLFTLIALYYYLFLKKIISYGKNTKC